jgi:signal peptidase I
VSDSAHNTAAPTAVGESFSPQPSANTKQHLLAAVLSAFIPGAGQLLLGERRKGIALLLVFACLLFCVWPLRLPRFYVGVLLIIWAWLALSFGAACAALFERRDQAAPKLSKWWLLSILPIMYIATNAVFTPVLLASGFRAREVASSSMQPTMLVGDRFMFDKSCYRHQPPTRNDLVVVQRDGFQVVKRVIAVGGDTIEGRDRQIIVNGRIVDEPFIKHINADGTNPELDTFGPITVPQGKYFVMGDNRDVSLDSRMSQFGLVDSSAIVGKPLYIYWSHPTTRNGKGLE